MTKIEISVVNVTPSAAREVFLFLSVDNGTSATAEGNIEPNITQILISVIIGRGFTIRKVIKGMTSIFKNDTAARLRFFNDSLKLLLLSCIPTINMEIGTVEFPIVSMHLKMTGGKCIPQKSISKLINAEIVHMFLNEEPRPFMLKFLILKSDEPTSMIIKPNEKTNTVNTIIKMTIR